MNAKVIRKFDKYELACTTSAYIELCKKFNGGLQEIANQIQKASDSKNEGMACDIIADIIVELVNGHYNKLVYESKYKKLNVDLKELKPISKEDIRKIAETKMNDLNAKDLEGAMSMIAGTCRSMGVVVKD